MTRPSRSPAGRRVKQGGWVKRERGPCRWCGGEVSGRRVTFCSQACVHEWKLRTDPAYLRAEVFERDRGVCAACGADTEALRRDKRKLDYSARRQFEKEWGRRRHLWDADHIVPVAEGGGECGLANIRTLCLKCHKKATAALVKRLSGTQQSGADLQEEHAEPGCAPPLVCLGFNAESEIKADDPRPRAPRSAH